MVKREHPWRGYDKRAEAVKKGWIKMPTADGEDSNMWQVLQYRFKECKAGLHLEPVWAWSEWTDVEVL